jgi:hypothetical protein
LTGLDLDIHTISRCESYLPNWLLEFGPCGLFSKF